MGSSNENFKSKSHFKVRKMENTIFLVNNDWILTENEV